MSATMASLAGQTYDKIAEFAHVLVDANWLDTAESVLYFFEKPWKYDREYGIWVDCDEPDTESPEWSAFCELIEETE